MPRYVYQSHITDNVHPPFSWIECILHCKIGILVVQFLFFSLDAYVQFPVLTKCSVQSQISSTHWVT